VLLIIIIIIIMPYNGDVPLLFPPSPISAVVAAALTVTIAVAAAFVVVVACARGNLLPKSATSISNRAHAARIRWCRASRPLVVPLGLLLLLILVVVGFALVGRRGRPGNFFLSVVRRSFGIGNGKEGVGAAATTATRRGWARRATDVLAALLRGRTRRDGGEGHNDDDEEDLPTSLLQTLVAVLAESRARFADAIEHELQQQQQQQQYCAANGEAASTTTNIFDSIFGCSLSSSFSFGTWGATLFAVVLKAMRIGVPRACVWIENVLAAHLLWMLCRMLWILLLVIPFRMGRVLTSNSSASSLVPDLGNAVAKSAFDFVRYHIPGVQQSMDRKALDMLADTEESMFHKDPNRTITRTLPNDPVPKDRILQQLKERSRQENAKWRQGRVSGTVYTDDAHQHQSEFMANVYELYAYSNPLHPGCWPTMNQAEAEVVSMCGHMLHAPPLVAPDPTTTTSTVVAGCVTSGGTESILLAVRAHLVHYGTRRGIVQPEIVCGTTAHAALNKAAEMYGITLVVVNCNPLKPKRTVLGRRLFPGGGDTSSQPVCELPPYAFQLDPHEVRRRITVNTVMIYASAPGYPQGIVDPIQQLGEIAHQYGVGLHVDACLGGFVLAFLDSEEDALKEGDAPSTASTPPAPRVPSFDFRNRGVTSMSIDTHKYGYSTKGTSVVLYRTRELRHAQYFAYPHWSGGMYATPTLAGSRPGALSVCAWASMLTHGQSGYRSRALRIADASRHIATGIATTIPELQLFTPIDQATVVVCFGSALPDVLDIYRVSDGMTSRGWVLNELQNPPCLHVCVTLRLCDQVGPFLSDLKLSVDDARREGADGRSKGTAGIYGAGTCDEVYSAVQAFLPVESHPSNCPPSSLPVSPVATLPEGPVECVLNAFTDLSLAP
jgi:sphinganine-1-phosphate aldolase